MAEQTDLEKITDIVTILTASIGAILGTLGFWRSVSTERKVTYRPAFQLFFEELNQQLKKYLHLAETLIQSLHEALAQPDLPDELPDLRQIDAGEYDLEHPVWQYDRGFQAHLNRTILASSRLIDAISSYNELRYPSSSAYTTWRGLMKSKYGEDIAKLRDRIDGLEPRDEGNLREVLKTIGPFVRGESTAIEDLKRSGKYHRHLRRKLRAVRRSMRRFDGLQASLERKRAQIESQLASHQPGAS